MLNPTYNAEQCAAALEEFGFSLVRLGQPGAPTPGRIADRISDIHGSLKQALDSGNLEGARDAQKELRRLLLALDSYDGGMMAQFANPEGSS